MTPTPYELRAVAAELRNRHDPIAAVAADMLDAMAEEFKRLKDERYSMQKRITRQRLEIGRLIERDK